MSRTRIGIVTFFNRMNYGADLQAYALQKKVDALGYECELIDILSPDDPLAQKPIRFAPLAMVRKSKLKNRIKSKINLVLGRVLGERHLRRRHAAFEEFKASHMVVSKVKYASVDDLYSCEMPYDMYIAGSDQVWNPSAKYTSPEPYFLTFAPENKKRIAYAPSFGVSQVPDMFKPLYRQWLEKMDVLSVRERHGAEIVRQVCGRRAQVVLDPTLLLTPDEWDEVARFHCVKKPYILLYDRIYSSYTIRLARHIKKMIGASILRIPQGTYRQGIQYGIEQLYEAGPSEFVGLFKNASFVLTSSFHGTAFALNFGKPFFTIVRREGPVNSRMESLLENVGLMSRLLTPGKEEVPDLDIAESGKDEAKAKLETLRADSVRYLTSAIEL